jgi:hypothetical protein
MSRLLRHVENTILLLYIILVYYCNTHNSLYYYGFGFLCEYIISDVQCIYNYYYFYYYYCYYI